MTVEVRCSNLFCDGHCPSCPATPSNLDHPDEREDCGCQFAHAEQVPASAFDNEGFLQAERMHLECSFPARQ